MNRHLRVQQAPHARMHAFACKRCQVCTSTYMHAFAWKCAQVPVISMCMQAFACTHCTHASVAPCNYSTHASVAHVCMCTCKCLYMYAFAYASAYTLHKRCMAIFLYGNTDTMTNVCIHIRPVAAQKHANRRFASSFKNCNRRMSHAGMSKESIVVGQV